MGTLAEEILSLKTKRECYAGDIIIVDLDYIMSHDTTTPLAIETLNKMEKEPFNSKKIIICFDHIYPASTIAAANLQKIVREFVKKHQITNFFQEGVCHQIMIEKGFVYPGAVIVGGDSHTCTYGALGAFSTGMGSTDIAIAYATGKTWLKIPKTIEVNTEGTFPNDVYPKDLILDIIGKIGADGATYMCIEFTGETIEEMSISGRATLTNMAIEMGGKTAIIEPDEKTKEVVGEKGVQIKAKNPVYKKVFEFEATDLVPKVACPHRVDNIKDVSDLEGINVDQVFIGTCTNGRLEDLEVVARMLKGKKVASNTRLIIIPASNNILMETYRKGFVDIFNEAGAIIGNPGCGPCIGRHQGVLGDEEVAVTTMNRNFRGRMGSSNADIYLTSPATAAATAVKGQIVDPREVN